MAVDRLCVNRCNCYFDGFKWIMDIILLEMML